MTIHPVLIILALLVGAAGVLSLTKATLGVGLLALACLLAIFARIAQASAHHDKLVQALERRTENP